MSAVYPIRPLMQERGFSIELGRFRFAAWDRRVVQRHTGDGNSYAAKPLISWRLGASAAVCMFVAVSIGLATQHASARSVYSVVVPVPDALPKARAVTSAKPEVHRASLIRPPLARVTSQPVPLPAPGLIAPTPAHSDVTQPAQMASVAKAVQLAMAIGEAQEWGDLATGAHGFVVAGAAEDTVRGQCRNLSILTRREGEPDTVKPQRICEPASSLPK